MLAAALVDVWTAVIHVPWLNRAAAQHVSAARFISTRLTALIQRDGRVHKNALSSQRLFLCFCNKNPRNVVQSVQQIVTKLTAYRSYSYNATFV
jgi:hypothetical protein